MTRGRKRKRAQISALSRKGRGGLATRVPEKHDPLDDVIDELARSLGLKIDKVWKPAIRTNLQVILRHGAVVASFSLDDEAEPAPVFKP